MNKLKLFVALMLTMLFSMNSNAIEQREAHKQAIGKDCKVCHDQGMKQPPSDTTCLKCHNIDDLVKKSKRSDEDKWQNPHNNLHYGKDLPCIECHGEHVKKQPLCKNCHTFKFDKFPG
ncbi:cytochrome C [Shewanella mangrovi]|uniref:Cytochrome C n=1 Tax=Shewanella mangrovi TaxID=1515746 RepID=A0A094K0U9_9GAMM|nr:cytochrome c3 family protein [Shewanella mangrovi]KFZ38286.1 cytochrome C [Shewanella mangrovi]